MANIATLTRLAALSDLPASGGAQSAFSPDGTYLALGASVTPFARVFKRTGDSFASLGNFPSNQPTVSTYKPEWHSDGNKLILNWLNASNYQNQYLRSGDVFNYQFGVLGTQSGAVRVTQDRTMVFCFLQVAPWVRIFNLNSDGTIGLSYTITWSGGTPTSSVLDGTMSSDNKKVVLGMNAQTECVRVYDVTAINTTSATITLTKRAASADQTVSASVNNMKFNADNKHLAVSRNDSTSGQAGARIYNVPDAAGTAYTLANRITGFSATEVSRSVAWNAAGTWLLAAFGSNVKLIPYDVTTDTYGMFQTMDVPVSAIISADISADGNYVSVVSSNAPVLTTFKVTYATDSLVLTQNTKAAGLDASSPVIAQAISPDSLNWAVIDNVGSGRSYSYLRSGTTLTSKASVDTGNTNRCMTWSPDSNFLVTTSTNNGGIVVYRRTSANGYTATIAGLAGALNASFSPDGKFLAVSISNAIALYQRNAGATGYVRVTITMDVTPTGAFSIAWSPDSKFIAIAVQNSPYVRIYRFDGVSAFTAVTQTVTLNMVTAHSVDISSDGSFIAILANNDTSAIYAFDAANGILVGDPIPITTANNTVSGDNQLGSAGKSVKWFPGVGSKAYLAYISSTPPYVNVGVLNTTTKLFSKILVPSTLGYAAAGDVSLTSDGKFLSACTHTNTDMDWFSTTYSPPVGGNGTITYPVYGQAVTTKMKFKATGNESYPVYGMNGTLAVPYVANVTMSYTKYGIQSVMGAFPKEYPNIGGWKLHSPIKVQMTTATLSQADPPPYTYGDLLYKPYSMSGVANFKSTVDAALNYQSYSLSGVGGTINVDGELNYLPYSASAYLDDKIDVRSSLFYGLYTLNPTVKMTNKLNGELLYPSGFGTAGEVDFIYGSGDLIYPSGYKIDAFAYQQLINGALVYPSGFTLVGEGKVAREINGELVYQPYSMSGELIQWYVEAALTYGTFTVDGELNVPRGAIGSWSYAKYALNGLGNVKTNINGDLLFGKFSISARVGFTATTDTILRYQKYILKGASGKPPNVEEGMSPYPVFGMSGSLDLFYGWSGQDNVKVRLTADSDLRKSPRTFSVVEN